MIAFHARDLASGKNVNMKEEQSCGGLSGS